MEVRDSFLTGSYMRNTMIAPLKEADIDIFVVLDVKYYAEEGHAALLDKVKRVLKKTYPKTPDISRSGRAVTITFTDFAVDVVPAFYRSGGGYLIPDSIERRWIATDPKQHIQIWSSANRAHAGDLIPLIKMVKGWNKRHSEMLRSFHLETMILSILDGVTISDFPSGVRYVLDKARSLVEYSIPDPAGYSPAGGYLSASELAGVVSRLDTAYTRAIAAEQLERNGRTAEAFEKWRLIFDDYFPAYG